MPNFFNDTIHVDKLLGTTNRLMSKPESAAVSNLLQELKFQLKHHLLPLLRLQTSHNPSLVVP